MHPTLFHLGRLAVSTEGVLVAFGLLAGLQLGCWLAPRRRIDPDRIWNLGLAGLLTLFLGERLLVIAFNLGDFIAHPLWMLGLVVVRDERYFYGGAALAIFVCVGYITAWRLAWAAVLDALAPAAGIALGGVSFGSLAAGTGLGRMTAPHWGIVYTSRLAASTAGTPLGIPLIPVALYAGLLYAVCAAGAAWLVLRSRQAGRAAALWFFAVGLGTVLLGQFRYRWPGEALVFNAFTPPQAMGIAAMACSCFLLLSVHGSNSHKETSS